MSYYVLLKPLPAPITEPAILITKLSREINSCNPNPKRCHTSFHTAVYTPPSPTFSLPGRPKVDAKAILTSTECRNQRYRLVTPTCSPTQ